MSDSKKSCSNMGVRWMRERLLALGLALLIVPLLSGMASAQDASHIVINDSRADHLDEDSDGDFDIVRVTASIGTTAISAEIAVEVIAENEDLSISFWNNTSLAGGETFNIQTTIKAWADGDFDVWLRVWDAETGTVVHDAHLGSHTLVASLTPPILSMQLESAPLIFTGDTCLVHRVSSDQVGAHYGTMGVVSIQGVPWWVGEHETPLDCSRWPAGDYTLTEHYRNGLGMSTSMSLSFRIHVHPPPAFAVNVTGRATEAGTPCEMIIEAAEGTQMPEMGVRWTLIDPAQQGLHIDAEARVDCTMWAPGVHKVRATLTSPQGRETTVALNLVRLPPADDASIEVRNASGDPDRWPSVSQGAEYEPEPLLFNPAASIAAVGVGGFIIALLAGILASRMIDRESKTDDEMWEDAPVTPDSDGLPSHVDESGIHWRQQPDGQVDWWDAETAQWLRFQG